MFYLSIENSPKLTIKIGVTTITRDRANFNKYMYLCLKEFVIPFKKKKKKGEVYLKLRQPKKSDSIQTKKRRNTGL